MTDASRKSQRMFALGRFKDGVMNKTEAAYEENLKRHLTAGLIVWYKFEAEIQAG